MSTTCGSIPRRFLRSAVAAQVFVAGASITAPTRLLARSGHRFWAPRGHLRSSIGHFMRDTHGHARVMTRAREPLRLDGFRRKCVERVTGIEPAWPAWKAGALPLSYTRALRGADSV